MKKRFYYLLLTCFMMLTLMGCNKKTEPIKEETTTAEAAAVEAVETEETAKEADAADNFTSFEDPKGAFTISFPGTPEENTQLMSGAGVSVELHSFMVETADSSYALLYNDYPEGMIVDPAVNLENAVSSLPSPAEESKDITLGDYPGKEVKYTAQYGSESVAVYSRFYLVGDRLYQLQVFKISDEGSSEADVFFDSFTLTE